MNYNYQNITYESGFIFDFWSCSSTARVIKKNGEKFAGGYPNGFLKRWKAAFADTFTTDTKILHVCAGAVKKEHGMRQDINPEFSPELLCDAEEIHEKYPQYIESFDWVIADPPYNEAAAQKYYNVPLLKKSKMLKSMERLCRPGGYIGILDQTMMNWKPHNLKRIALIAVTAIPNLDARLFTVYRKEI